MTNRAVRVIAAEVGRRIRARRRGPSGPHPSAARPRGADAAHPLPSAVSPEESRADGAELDALRGALVRELDRLAAEDAGSAGFRRA